MKSLPTALPGRRGPGTRGVRARAIGVVGALTFAITGLLGVNTLTSTPAYADENCAHSGGSYWADPFTLVTYQFLGQSTYYFGSSLYHEHHYYENWINVLPWGGFVWQGDIYPSCPVH